MDANLAKLRYWMSLDERKNTTVRLAQLLEYKTDNTIRMWFTRGHIPQRELKNVMEIIDGEINQSNQKR
jgi:hypothetical protein